MRNHLKFIGKSIIFICILCICIQYVYRVIVPKYWVSTTWPTTSTYVGFYEMEKSTVDVLFLGSSHAATSFIPQELYNHYGITSYNLSCEQQNPVTSYFWLKEALRYQQPKVVVLDCLMCFPYMNEEPLNSSGSMTRKAMDYMKWSPVKREAVRTLCALDTNQSLISYYFPNLQYHTRWKEFAENDFLFMDRAKHYELKGYTPLADYGGEDYAPFEMGESVDEEEMVPLMREYFDKISELCKQEEIALILVKTSCTSDNIGKYNTIQNYAAAHDLQFIDFNRKDIYEELDYDFHKNNHDSVHANLWGAQKMTNYLGEVLTSHYGIVGKSDEQWESTKEYYEGIQKDCILPHISDIDEYLMMIKDDRYSIFISMKDECTRCLKDSTVQKLRDLGLSANLQGENNCSYLAVISGNEIEEQMGYDRLKYGGSIRSGLLPYEIDSAGIDYGNTSSIKLRQTEYSKNQRGLNIVVYSNDTLKVVDSVCFDTYAEENNAIR